MPIGRRWDVLATGFLSIYFNIEYTSAIAMLQIGQQRFGKSLFLATFHHRSGLTQASHLPRNNVSRVLQRQTRAPVRFGIIKIDQTLSSVGLGGI
jgi:hypothetical protein